MALGLVWIILLAWLFIVPVSTSWMHSTNFFRLCRTECIPSKDEPEPHCSTDYTVDSCNPFEGANSGRSVISNGGYFCAGECNFHDGATYSWCNLCSSWDYCDMKAIETQHLTSYGFYCTTACGLHGDSYYWCYRDTHRRWDYCSPRKLTNKLSSKNVMKEMAS